MNDQQIVPYLCNLFILLYFILCTHFTDNLCKKCSAKMTNKFWAVNTCSTSPGNYIPQKWKYKQVYSNYSSLSDSNLTSCIGV